MMRFFLLWVGLFGWLPLPVWAEEEIRFPQDSGYVNLRTRYGAKGDGTSDDTEAFRKAIADDVRSLYLPKGTYLISDSIVLGGKRWILQGEGCQQTILKLKDQAEGFQDPKNPKPFVSTFKPFMDPKANMGQAFRNSLFDLTIDIGVGNPGAVGLHYLNNNQGTIRNVTIRSSDPQRVGKAGIALVTNWPGPALLDQVRIEGFDLGIWSTISQYSLVLDRVTLEQQRQVGIDNSAQMLTIRRLRSNNMVPALRNRGSAAFVTLLDCECTGGKESNTAVESIDGGTLVVYRLHTQGYASAIRSQVMGEAQVLPGPKVDSFVSHPLLPMQRKDPFAPMNKIEDAPDVVLPTLREWANVTAFGAKTSDGKNLSDAGPAIQKAIDSGKSVIYFPRGTYVIRTPIQVRGRVQYILGMDSRIRGLTGTDPIWKIEDGEAPFVMLERLESDYGSTSTMAIEHASKRSLFIRQSLLGGYRNTVPGGKVFLEDVCGQNWDFQEQTVWVRQLNPEAKGKVESSFNLRLNKSQAWLLGVKTEGPKTILSAKNSQVELWGGFFYASRGTDAGAAAIDLIDSDFTGSWINHLGGSYRPQVRSKHKDRTEEFHLHVDFTNRNQLNLVRKQLRGEEILEEKKTTQKERSSDNAFRHGSYGIKVPFFQVNR